MYGPFVKAKQIKLTRKDIFSSEKGDKGTIGKGVSKVYCLEAF